MTETSGKAVLASVKWRLLPMAMLMFFMSLLDRTNISFVALDMSHDLGLTLAQYGLAAGIFYIGYFVFEVPSNFALQRLGARRDLVFATLLSTTALAYAAGGPFTTWLMTFAASGLADWQTMCAVQVTVGVGIAALVALPSRIADAAWLTASERDWLQHELDAEETRKKTVGATTLRQGFLDYRVLMIVLCTNFVLFLPQVLKPGFPAFTNLQIGLLVSFSFAVGGVAGIAWGRHSDRSGDRKWHMAAGAVLGAAGFGVAAAAAAAAPALQFAAICVAVTGVWAIFGAFWAYAGDLLGGAAAAGGLAVINSVGSLGGPRLPGVSRS